MLEEALLLEIMAVVLEEEAITELLEEMGTLVVAAAAEQDQEIMEEMP